MVRDCVANVVMRLQDCRFDPARSGMTCGRLAAPRTEVQTTRSPSPAITSTNSCSSAGVPRIAGIFESLCARFYERSCVRGNPRLDDRRVGPPGSPASAFQGPPGGTESRARTVRGRWSERIGRHSAAPEGNATANAVTASGNGSQEAMPGQHGDGSQRDDPPIGAAAAAAAMPSPEEAAVGAMVLTGGQPVNGDGLAGVATTKAQEPKKNAAPRGRPRGDRDLERESTAEILMRIAVRGRYFPGDDDRFYSQFAVGDHEETHELRSSSFRRWLIREFHKETRGFVPVEALNNLIATLEADAEDAGPLQNVHLRVGGDLEGAVIYLDLGDPTRRAVAITADGWEIVARPGVTFRRPKGMRPLPEPHRGGSLDVLKKYVNTDDDEFLLLIGWLAAALRPTGPYPIMVLNAEQGSAKSTLARIVRKLVDPHASPLAGDPREPRDLMVAAQNCWALALDNISSLPPWLSDYLCRLATGGGLHARTLYSIPPPPPPPPFPPPPPPPLICPACREWPTSLTSGRRFARASGTPGTFLAAYHRNRQAAVESVLEDSPVARTIRALIDDAWSWTGTAAELLDELTSMAGETDLASRAWPRTPKGLSSILRRIAPQLRTTGLAVKFDRGKYKRTITVNRVVMPGNIAS